MSNRRVLLPIMAATLLLAAPTVQAAEPVGTTQITNATAFFTAVDSNDPCESDHLVVTLAQDAFRSVEAGGPPALEPWFDVQVWHESGCESPVVSGYVQQTVRGPETYGIEVLSSAFIEITFPIYDGESVIRTFEFDLAWVAVGPITHTVDVNPDGTKVTVWDTGADLSGTIIDSAGLVSMQDLDYATLGIGNYVIY
jgi:hypothetical protein